MHEPWQLVRLSDVARVSHGWAFPSSACRSPRGGAPRLIRIGDFARTSRSHFLPERVQEYVGDYPDRFALEPGDLLMAMTCQSADGEILGVTMRVPDNGERYLHNQRLGRIQILDETRVDSKFLELSFAMPAFNQHLFTSASGSKILHTSPGRILDYEMLLPPLEEQRRIAGVLGAFDDLLVTNASAVQALVSMCDAIFVQRFGDRELDTPVGDLAAVIDCLHSKKPERIPEDTHWLIQLGNILDNGLLDSHDRYGIGADDYQKWTSKLETRPWDAVITNVGRVGAVARIGNDVRAALGRNMTAVRPHAPDRDGAFLTVGLLSRPVRREIARHTDDGTILSALNVRSIPLLRLPEASIDERALFHETCAPLLESADSLLLQNHEVRAVRDELLPLLLSGRVRVGEVAA